MTTPDLSIPSLAGLSYALRNLRTVLPRHEYNHQHYGVYTGCGTAGCALGVCQVLWPNTFGAVLNRHGTPCASDYFGEEVRGRIFHFAGYDCAPYQVTPNRVADLLDECLAEHGETRGASQRDADFQGGRGVMATWASNDAGCLAYHSFLCGVLVCCIVVDFRTGNLAALLCCLVGVLFNARAAAGRMSSLRKQVGSDPV